MKPLQEFGHDESAYERPNERWICGRKAEGKECLRGPGRWGTCRGSALCVPVLDAKTQVWSCGRQPHRGGKCAEGPLPAGRCSQALPGDGRCQPIRSLRSRRGLLSFNAALAATALVLLAGAGPDRLRLLDPGPVCSAHAGLECSTCHTRAGGNVASWAGAFLRADGRLDDSRSCLGCHDLGANGTDPHGLDPVRLEAETAALEARLGTRRPDRPTVSCGTCHREHQGRSADLTSLTDSQCQACHTAAFDGFAGHRDFRAFPRPADSTRPVVFDHGTHFHSWFPSSRRITGAAAPTCRDCHVFEPGLEPRLAPRLDRICMACHESDITYRVANPEPLAEVSLPEPERSWQDLVADEPALVGGPGPYRATRGVCYEPREHQDETARHLIEQLVARLAREGRLTGRRPAGFGRLASCLRCHKIVSDGSGRPRVAWRFAAHPTKRSQRSPFAHDPHLTYLGANECGQCHVLIDSFEAGRPPVPDILNWTGSDRFERPDFLGIRKEHCASCHARGSGRDRCTTCHDYHDVEPLPASRQRSSK